LSRIPADINAGGDLWILGFKNEEDGTLFKTTSGGRTELLGGTVMPLDVDDLTSPAFEIIDASASFVVAGHVQPFNSSRSFYPILVREERSGSDPTDPESRALPGLEIVEIGPDRFLALSYNRLAGGSGTPGIDYTAHGLTYSVEFSELLSPGSWSSLGAPLTIHNPDHTVIVSAVIAIKASLGKQHLRSQEPALPWFYNGRDENRPMDDSQIDSN
jgi:hypothetical protein